MYILNLSMTLTFDLYVDGGGGGGVTNVVIFSNSFFFFFRGFGEACGLHTSLSGAAVSKCKVRY